MSDYINPNELYYSAVFPNGIYAHYVNDNISIPIPDSLTKTKITPTVRNILTHEVFFCKRIFIGSDAQKAILIREILNPSNNYASWPVDIIAIDEIDANTDNLVPAELRHLYCDEYHSTKEQKTNYALLFPYLKKDTSGRGGYAYYTPLDVWLRNEPLSQRTYKNDKIKRVCYNLAHVLSRINRDGYVYFDFSTSRFMLKSDLTVMPEYSNLLMEKTLNTKKYGKDLSAKYGLIPLDFVDPFIYFRHNSEQINSDSASKDFNLAAQNYSLAAMLFYLMFGRKPYEGHRLMQNRDDESDEVSHYAYLKNYYLKEENIHFIFDDSYENPNLLTDDYTDMFSGDIELWENCPKELKELFISALQRQSALRDPYTRAPKPGTWVHAFESLGWGGSK